MTVTDSLIQLPYLQTLRSTGQSRKIVTGCRKLSQQIPRWRFSISNMQLVNDNLINSNCLILFHVEHYTFVMSLQQKTMATYQMLKLSC